MNFDFSKIDDIRLFSASYDKNLYNIDCFKDKLLPVVKQYAIKYDQKLIPYDKLHKGINSVNSNFSLYFIDDEIIIFINSYSYIDLTLNDNNELVLICCNMDLVLQATVLANSDKILNNVFLI